MRTLRLLVGGLCATALLSGLMACTFAGNGGLAEALRDGEISDAEYRAAVESSRRCVAERGWDVSKLETEPFGVRLYFTLEVPPGQNPQRDYDQCIEMHSAEIERIYLEQQILTGAEKEKALDSLLQCFKDIPVEGVLRSDSSKQLLRKASTQYEIGTAEMSAALMCMHTHQYAITDQADPDE